MTLLHTVEAGGRDQPDRRAVLRRSLDQPKDPRPINDAEPAWSELEIVRGLRPDKPADAPPRCST